MKIPGLHICCPDGNLASQERRRDGTLFIRFRGKTESDNDSPWTNEYKPGTFTPIGKAADHFPDGGGTGFLQWLKGRCRIETLGVGSEILGGIIYYEPIWRAFLQRLMTNLVDDGIRWFELR